jgi:hypothetical protein
MLRSSALRGISSRYRLIDALLSEPGEVAVTQFFENEDLVSGRQEVLPPIRLCNLFHNLISASEEIVHVSLQKQMFSDSSQYREGSRKREPIFHLCSLSDRATKKWSCCMNLKAPSSIVS